MKRFVLLICAGLVAGCGKKSEAPAPQPLPVTVDQPVKREVIIYKEFPSTLTGAKEIEIRARVSGVLELDKNAPQFAGERVDKDTPLFVIEPEVYAQQRLAAQAGVDQALASSKLAQERFDRIERASKSKAVSEVDLEVAAAELAESKAAISQYEAELENAKINESYTVIQAPITGRMSRLLVDPGNLVGSTEKTLLAKIIDDSSIYAYFEVPERSAIRYFEKRDNEDAEQVFEKEIRLKLANGDIYEKTGRIDYIANEVDPGTRTVKVRAVFDNAEGALSSGLYGLIGYPAGPNIGNPLETEALLVPSVSVQRDLGGSFVWVVDDKNIVRRRAVEPGDTVEKPVNDPNAPRTLETVIRKGLSEDDKVIVSGFQRAREGAPVTPMPVEGAKNPATSE
ncbi:MAG: efflux RND transporter periplasmic adaptor subunit [Akkermansiaceae bacterium]